MTRQQTYNTLVAIEQQRRTETDRYLVNLLNRRYTEIMGNSVKQHGLTLTNIISRSALQNATAGAPR